VDGSASSTASIQRAIDLCGNSGGGTVYIPAGRFVVGTLWMRRNITLYLDSGATLLGDSNPDSYPLWRTQWEGPNSRSVHAPLIAGEGLTNITITGRGVIDGRGQTWWQAFDQGKLANPRPHLVRLVDCRDVLIEGIHFVNSPRWTINPVACDNLTIAKVTIRNPPDSPNTDGIDPDSCSNVHIADCHIDTGDDCIAIKSGCEEDGRRLLRPCHNITISNCTMLHGHGGVVVGSEMSGGVRNVAITNCVFSGTDRGIRLKSRRGRGNAVEDMRVDNIVMDDVLCPIVLNLFYTCGASKNSPFFDHGPLPVNTGTPQFRRLRFSNITARNVKYAAAFLLGLPEMFIDDVVLDGISVQMDPGNSQAGSPAMTAAAADMCRAGFVLKHARNIKLRRIDLYDQLGPAINISNCQDIFVGDLYASAIKGPVLLVDGVGSPSGDEDDGEYGAIKTGQEGQRIHTFTRRWHYGRRRPSGATSEAALTKLAAQSPDHG
jgi:polygalacturonase